MKKITLIFMAMVALMFIAFVSHADNYDKAMKEIKAEKKVLDASWGPYKGSSLYVAVENDGTKRDGYAQYLCMVLNDYNIKGVVIHVMTLKNMKKYNTKNDLGNYICK